MMTLTPPAPDQLELSVFGRGYGEAICVHLGNGDWAVVDSCINPDTGAPAALSYLSDLGLSASEVVKLVVATHWDDDHIQGLGEIVELCADAQVVCSAALRRGDIVAFVIDQEAAKGKLGSGVDELRRILRACAARQKTVTWAKANLPLHPRPPGDAPLVVALSPSDDAFERSLESLIEAATASRVTLQRRYRAPEGPNGASVAATVRKDDVAMLLGADLETSANAETGWDGVIKYSKPTVAASIVKIPHHGSVGAHHDGIFSELASDDPIAIVSPWALGAKFLPTERDLDRLRSFCTRVYLTAMPSLVRAKKDRDLDRLIRRLHGDDLAQLTGWGHVRARRTLGDKDWHIELFGDAVAV